MLSMLLPTTHSCLSGYSPYFVSCPAEHDLLFMLLYTDAAARTVQGSHASLKVLESTWKYLNFFILNSRPWKYLKTGQVLESPWLHQVKLCNRLKSKEQKLQIDKDSLTTAADDFAELKTSISWHSLQSLMRWESLLERVESSWSTASCMTTCCSSAVNKLSQRASCVHTVNINLTYCAVMNRHWQQSQQNTMLLDLLAVSASGFVKLIDWRTSSWFLSTTRSFNMPCILPNTRFVNNCHVLFLSTITVPKSQT